MAIGLGYICKELKLQYKDVAKMIGVSPGTFNDWISGRRKIPEIRISELAELEVFKGISVKYFQKELEEIEEHEIVSIVLKNGLQYEDIEDTLIEDDGNVVHYMREVLVGGSIEHIMFNDAKTEFLKSIKRVKNSLNLNSCEDFSETINKISEHEEFVGLFAEILESEKLNEYGLKKILKESLYAILIHLNERKGFGNRYEGHQDNKLVQKLVEVFVIEEARRKKEKGERGMEYGRI